MQVVKKRFPKKIVLLAAIIAVVLAAGGVLAYNQFVVKDNPSQTKDTNRGINEIDYGEPTENDDAQTDSSKDKDAQEGPKDPNQNPEDPEQQPAELAINMTQAAQNGTQVVIRAIVTGANSGTCNLTMSQPGQPSIHKSAIVSVAASTAICEGFNIPLDEFPAGGEWLINLDVRAGSAISAPATKTIQVTK